MTFRTITTFLHCNDTPTDALEYAIETAQRYDAHLSVIVAGLDKKTPNYYYAGAQAVALQRNLARARNMALATETSVTRRLERSTLLSFDVETVTLQETSLAAFIANHARMSDLMVLPAPFSEERTTEDLVAVEAALFLARLPVIIVPDGFKPSASIQTVLIAWNDDIEALAATKLSLPFVSNADRTEIVIVDPPRHGPNRSDPGGSLAQFIARHGANANISVLAKSEPKLSNILCKKAREIGADLIVMGAYGHSRMREAILGGATRDMLEFADRPVLMAH